MYLQHIYFKTISNTWQNFPLHILLYSIHWQSSISCLFIHFFKTHSIGECALDDNFGVSGNNPVNKLILHDTYWRNYNDVLATSRIYIKRWGVKHLDINLQREDGKKDNVTPSNTNLTFKYAPKDFDCAVFNWNTCIDCVNVIKVKKKFGWQWVFPF